MVETAETVRAKIEAAKVALIDLQHSKTLPIACLDLSSALFSELDKAWTSATRLVSKNAECDRMIAVLLDTNALYLQTVSRFPKTMDDLAK